MFAPQMLVPPPLFFAHIKYFCPKWYVLNSNSSLLLEYGHKSRNMLQLSLQFIFQYQTLFLYDSLLLITALTGICYFFVRTTSKQISTSNIANEVNFGILDAREGGLLKGIEELLGRVMVPALKAQSNWGQLTANGGGNEQQVRKSQICFFDETGQESIVNSITEIKKK